MNKKSNKFIGIFFICTLSCIFATILIKFSISSILVKCLGVSNSFTQFILQNDDSSQVKSSVEEISVPGNEPYVEWLSDYRFPDAEYESFIDTTIYDIEASPSEPIYINITNDFSSKIQDKIDSIKFSINAYSAERLFGYEFLKNLAGYYESAISWNFVSMSEYNPGIFLDDGHMTSYISKRDITEDAISLINFDEFCSAVGTELVYVQLPYKISKYTDLDVSGILDFSNQNADDLLTSLEEAGIDTFDIREQIKAYGFNHHDLFYRTDHHWKVETGLWASQQILNYLNNTYNLNSNTEILDLDQFDIVEYPSWYLGSYGRKATLSRSNPDDFSLLYPKYDTCFDYYVPSLGIDEIGNFSITYDMSQVEEIDYYNKNPYSANSHSDMPLIQIHNININNSKKILLIHESFSDCVISFLALGNEYVDAIDLRYFYGSLEIYIEKTNPDIVVIAYNPDVLGTGIDLDHHSSLFDFR